MDYHQFYLALDNEFLADRIKSLVGFLGANWRILGRPILTMKITHSMLGRLVEVDIATVGLVITLFVHCIMELIIMGRFLY